MSFTWHAWITDFTWKQSSLGPEGTSNCVFTGQLWFYYEKLLTIFTPVFGHVSIITTFTITHRVTCTLRNVNICSTGTINTNKHVATAVICFLLLFLVQRPLSKSWSCVCIPLASCVWVCIRTCIYVELHTFVIAYTKPFPRNSKLTSSSLTQSLRLLSSNSSQLALSHSHIRR